MGSPYLVDNLKISWRSLKILTNRNIRLKGKYKVVFHVRWPLVKVTF